MKIGIFSNVYGNVSRLEELLKSFKHEEVDRIVSLGNLFSQIDETNLLENPGISLDQNSLVCLEAIDAWAKSTGIRTDYFKGKTEYDLLLREVYLGRGRSKLYNQFVINFDISEIADFGDLVYCLDSRFREYTEKLDKNDILKISDPLSKISGLRVCIVDNNNKQEAYEVKGKNVSYIAEKEIIIEPDRLYIASPSSRDKGHIIFDGYSIRLK